jgi:hypothetical protein
MGVLPEWRTLLQPIRTASLIHASIKILPVMHPPVYQQLLEKVVQLKTLGMTYTDIAKKLNIDPRTARKSSLWNRHKLSPLISSPLRGEDVGGGDITSSPLPQGERTKVRGHNPNPKESH